MKILKKSARKKMTLADMPKNYAELVAFFPPRPIHDQADYDNTVEVIDILAGHRLNKDQEDYLEAISLMVYDYEQNHCKIDLTHVTPRDLLEYLLDEHRMTVSDLGKVIGSQPLASLILSGKREMSKTVIRKVADHFHVDPGLFL